MKKNERIVLAAMAVVKVGFGGALVLVGQPIGWLMIAAVLFWGGLALALCQSSNFIFEQTDPPLVVAEGSLRIKLILGLMGFDWFVGKDLAVVGKRGEMCLKRPRDPQGQAKTRVQLPTAPPCS